jgi:hypothetical protein
MEQPMPTLLRRQDSQYIVRHFYLDFATWQISPDGVSYLRRRRIEQDGRFTTDQFMHLWMNGWVYTGDHPGAAPGPSCVGDRDVPQDLRDAIHEFHSTLANGQCAAAWRFVSATRTVGSLIPKDMLHVFDAQQFKVFQEKVTGALRSRFHSWLCLDIRTVISGIEYVATIEIDEDVDHAGIGRRPVELNEHWVQTPSGWNVKWDGFPGLDAG